MTRIPIIAQNDWNTDNTIGMTLIQDIGRCGPALGREVEDTRHHPEKAGFTCPPNHLHLEEDSSKIDPRPSRDRIQDVSVLFLLSYERPTGVLNNDH
jgi:hypothetical protein